MKQALIILNPWAGRGSAGARRADLEETLRRAGVTFDLVTTHARGGATELAWQGVERGYPQIIAVGGDGTINEVVNGIKGAEENTGRRAQLGVVPLGTGSDFVKSLDNVEPNDVIGATRRIAEGRSRLVDVGQVRVGEAEWRYFVNGLGMGLDAQVAAEALKVTRLKGIAVYFLAIIRAVTHYKAHPMTVRFDERSIHRRLLFATVANGRCQGGGFWLTPEAEIDDGLMDLCIVDRMRLDEIIRHIPKVMDGTHTSLRQVTMAQARSIKVECSAPTPVAVDGEVIATDARTVAVETIAQGLEVLV